MDLINRKVLVVLAKSERQTCGKDYDFDGLLSDIENAPTVPAVPLDKLCEFLGGAVTPCILLNIGCPYNEATRKDCDSCRAREAWEITLSKWMEEQDEQKEANH